MRKSSMYAVGRHGNHQAAPKASRGVPNVCGDYDLDARILKCKNRDMAARLDQHISRSGPVTGYRGYRNYNGDS